MSQFSALCPIDKDAIVSLSKPREVGDLVMFSRCSSVTLCNWFASSLTRNELDSPAQVKEILEKVL